jgi:hypothetical protein
LPVASGKRRLSPIFLDQAVAAEQPDIKARWRAAKRFVFGWYGGKFSRLEWLLLLLPAAHHDCEPFAGSGAVLLNRDPAPVETYNGLDGEVVNFSTSTATNRSFWPVRSVSPHFHAQNSITPSTAECALSSTCHLRPS